MSHNKGVDSGVLINSDVADDISNISSIFFTGPPAIYYGKLLVSLQITKHPNRAIVKILDPRHHHHHLLP